jgi:viroplasmin and RNaseH domain-containing protein
MGIEKEIINTTTYTCDNCGKKIEDLKKLIIFSECKKDCLRLIEEVKEYSYESYNLPKDKKCFCSVACAKNHLLEEIDLFILEMQIKHKGRTSTDNF